MSTTTACFSVDGDWLTDYVRELWEHGDGDRALRTLETLEGITVSQCLDILEGRMKLTGNSADEKGLAFVPDSHKGRTLREYFAKQKAQIDDLEDRVADTTQMATGDTAIVGSHDGPREVPVRKTEKDRIGRRVLREGVEFDDCPNPNKKNKALSVYSESEAFRDVGTEAEDTDDSEQEKEYPKPAGEMEVTSHTGWISPEGLFYPCVYGKHAETLFLLGIVKNSYYAEAPDWVKMCVTSIGKRQVQHFWGEHTLFTEKQLQMIDAWVKKSGCDQPHWMED